MQHNIVLSVGTNQLVSISQSFEAEAIVNANDKKDINNKDGNKQDMEGTK